MFSSSKDLKLVNNFQVFRQIIDTPAIFNLQLKFYLHIPQNAQSAVMDHFLAHIYMYAYILIYIHCILIYSLFGSCHLSIVAPQSSKVICYFVMSQLKTVICTQKAF